MDKDLPEKENENTSAQQAKETKSFQELSSEIVNDPNLKRRQPTPQPKELDEIDY